jgi:hypothetical protein
MAKRTRTDRLTQNLISKTHQYLQQLGYSNIEQDRSGQIFIPGKFGNATFLVVGRALDPETVEFRAAYYSQPQGEADDVIRWKDRVHARPLGTAGMYNMECPPNGKILYVRGQLRTTDTDKGTKGLLYYLMFSIREYFRHWEDDGDYADELGLTFQEVDSRKPFCGDS